MPLFNLLLIVLAGYVIYRILSRATILHRLTEYLRSKIRKSDIVQPVSFEELMIATGGYGVASVLATKKSGVVGETLRTSGLREKDITVLSLERGTEMISNPPADTLIVAGDGLVCFGKTDIMRKAFGSEAPPAE
jgi:Trk K+ transport system NAD-binding subunit